jgi:protein-tyrosine-phosphatase
MAEGYFRHLCRQAGRDDVVVSSAGVFAVSGAPVSGASKSVMAELGIDVTNHRSTQLLPERVHEADIVVAMTRAHRRQILDLEPSASDKTRILLEFGDGVRRAGDVPDPIGGDESAYRICFETMKPALENLFLDICSKQNPDLRKKN